MAERVKITGDLFHPVVPDGAVRVDRRTKWGNPHPVGRPCRVCANAIHTRDEAIARYRADLFVDRDLFAARLPVTPDDVRRELAGRDLACWCKPGEACHANVLLEVANP